MSALCTDGTCNDEDLGPAERAFLNVILNDLLLAGILETWINGLYALMLIMTGYMLVKKHGWTVWKRPLVALMPLLYFFSTLHLGMRVGSKLRWSYLRTSFMFLHSSKPSINYYAAPMWMDVLGSLAVILGILIADCILIWRCWVICNRQWASVILPSLLTVAGFVIGAWATHTSLRWESVTFGSSTAKAYAYSLIIQNSLNLATSMVTTITIVVRIVTLRRGNVSRYRTILETLIETAALYSIVLALNIMFITLPTNVTNAYTQEILVQFTGLAPTLILARVTMGYTQPNSGASRRNDASVFGQSSLSSIRAPGSHISRSIPLTTFSSTHGNMMSPAGSASKDLKDDPGILVTTERSSY